MSFDNAQFMKWLEENTNYSSLKVEANAVFSGWQVADGAIFFGKLKEVVNFSEKIIDLIEKFARTVDGLSSKDKLEAAVDFIDELVDFNFILEWFDGIAIKLILSAIVEQKNKCIGHNWFPEVK